MPVVLFVCTGNLCRSPMAAALLRARLARSDEPPEDWQVESAGTWAVDGQMASAYAIEEMAARSLDLRSHRSRAVTREMVERADLILAMTQQHRAALVAAFPDQAHKVHLLSEMVGADYDIADPYGGTRLEYAYIALELEQLLDAGFDRIVRLARSHLT